MRGNVAFGLAVLVLSVAQQKTLAGSECKNITQPTPSTVAENTTEYGTTKTYRRNGSLVCPLNCQQGTIYYPDNNECRCICKKNFGLYGDEQCKRAFWSRWSSWSKCLVSDWGGVQRRERICQVQGMPSPENCDGRGSIARSCSPVRKGFRIRKNVNDLSDEEFHDLLQAMTKFKKDNTKRGYRNIISWHGYPGRCPWYSHIMNHDDNHCSFHHHPLFQSWHRLITVQLELGLSRHLRNKTMGIPFYDWTEEGNNFPYLLRDPEIFDPILKKRIKNPFHRTFIKSEHGVNRYSFRMPNYQGFLMSRYLLKGAIRAMLCHSHSNHEFQVSNVPHDQIHNCACVNMTARESVCSDEDNDCKFSLASPQYASWDPAFLLHHSAMDRLFVMRRILEEQNGVSDWTKSRVVRQYEQSETKLERDIAEAFDWPMSPFRNKSMNPERVTRKKRVWTMRNAFYNEQLFGYKYDNFNFGHNYTWEDLQRDFKRNVIYRTFWNDDYFVTKLGDLTTANSLKLDRVDGCTQNYSNPKWRMSIQWH